MPEIAVDRLVERLYEQRLTSWNQALSIMNSWLEQRCHEALGENCDEARLSVQAGRIKDPDRVVDKIRRKGLQCSTPDDIEDGITDIIATKVLCKSTRDQRILHEFLNKREGGDIEHHHCDDYVTCVKPSGYRAVHYLFKVPIPDCKSVTVELQIKTRLQDAWGELTHEDLYKPGGALRPQKFHQSVGLSMANLLAEVDRLADELAEDITATMESEDVVPADSQRPPTDEGVIEVVVRASGPRYAIAVDEHGTQGIILASNVRRLAGTNEFISVSAFVNKGDKCRAQILENEKGRVYELVELPAN